MKKFDEFISPLSWLILFIGFLPNFIILFRPSILEFGVFFIVDYIAMVISVYVGKKSFLRLYPDSLFFMLGLDFPAIANCTKTERIALFQSMVRFPARRAVHTLFLNIIKAIPGFLVIVFYWEHNDVSNWVQAAKVLFPIMVIWSYFYAAIFIENHMLISTYIGELHAKYDWADIFRDVTFPFRRNDFEIQEVIALASVWFFVMALQLVSIMTSQAKTVGTLAFEVLMVSLAGMVLISRIWYLGRQYFTSGLESIFKVLDTLDLESSADSLPLHSSALLAHFEKVFNNLLERLRSYKKELSTWVSVQTEESRYRALGEISALIVHDLSAPLHVINFCTERLKERPELMQDPRYLQELTLNGSRSVELIDSLRTYLKGSSGIQERAVSFSEVHGRVIRLLETQYYSNGFKGITFAIDHRVLELNIKITKADLTHILMNLFKNSIANLIDHRIPDPRISVELIERTKTRVVISIKDNGTGLTQERFSTLTDMPQLPGRGDLPTEGLGLRLIRRLVERYGGSLVVVNNPDHEQGTNFHLSLLLEQAVSTEVMR